MDKSKFTMDVNCDRPGLQLAIKIDDIVGWQGDPNRAGTIEIEFDDQDGDHQLHIELSGKQAEHTKINELGEIQEDLLVEIKNIYLDNINIDQLVHALGAYHHDFNGSKSPTIEKFYNYMGCNGRVSFAFSSPVYLWLLENI